MFVMFFGLLGLERVDAQTAAKVVAFLGPGFDQLTKWLPTFFVPGVVMMPLSPPLSGGTVGRLLLLNAGGLVINFFVASRVAGLLIKANGGAAAPSAPAAAPAAGGKHPYPMELAHKLFGAAAVAAAVAVGTGSPQAYAVTMLAATVGGFVAANHLPANVKTICSPFIVSSLVGLAACAALAPVSRIGGFKDLVRDYTRKQGGLGMGAGDVLLGLLGPSILSFGLSMYHRRALIAQNLAVVVGTNLFSAAFSLLGTAVLARALGLAAGLRTSTVMRNVTMALGLPLFEMLGGANASVAVAMIILTGILGQNFGQILMDRFRVRDPVARGLAMGISGHGLGTAALAQTEKDAFPFSALAMALNGSFAVCLAALPPFRRLLLSLAGVAN